ncbi:MAG: hypothetical protein ACOCZQ_00205 [Nanoarchaeota archaeon]
MANKEQDNSEQELSNMVKDLTRRLRQMEERYTNLRNSMQVTEQNMLSQSKKNTTDKQTLQADISELKKHIRNMGEEMKIVTKELGNTAKKDDVKVLEKYISFWEPLSFVTRNELKKEVKRLVKKELEEQTKKVEQNQNI